MKHFLLALALVALSLCSGPFVRSHAKEKVRSSMIVSTDWLAKHLNDKSLVLLQVGDKKEYEAAHIPGAQYIQTADISTPRGQGLILELPPVEQLKAAFEKLGVTDESRIIVYFSKDWVTPTARVYFTLDYLGLGDRTSILDGGLPAWIAEHRPVAAEVKTANPGHFTPRANRNLVVDATWVSANLNKPGVAILDARDAKFYTGAEAGMMPRAGHIPSAKSIPFGSLIEDANNKFKSPDALRQLFTTAGVKQSDSVATYCHIGQQASLLYFVARYLGYDAHLYDGSFQDWSNRKDLPVEKSEGVTTEAKPKS
ncbi:MAG TPA: sulfurtransferase [Pyrinomonadaceae bacterium]|jgi:thiosulfate/3-mercaptopyruvate sulfurtransferase|nr:sulfurtransferase [Pyrinomonadaceae bacterium]